MQFLVSVRFVSRQVHVGSFILYNLEKTNVGLWSLGLESHSVGLVLRLFFFNLWTIWGLGGGSGGIVALMLQPYNPQ